MTFKARFHPIAENQVAGSMLDFWGVHDTQIADRDGNMVAQCFSEAMATRIARLLNEERNAAHPWEVWSWWANDTDSDFTIVRVATYADACVTAKQYPNRARIHIVPAVPR